VDYAQHAGDYLLAWGIRERSIGMGRELGIDPGREGLRVEKEHDIASSNDTARDKNE